MEILFAFSPFLCFALGDRLLGPTQGLAAGALAAAVLLIRSWMGKHSSPKILETGTMILFAGLALYSFIANPGWSIMLVRLCVDTGLLLIVLFTLAIRQPFTLQYAREQVDKNLWDTPEFRRTNDIITAAWAAAFAAMAAADLLMLSRPDTGKGIGIIATVGALYAAAKFTAWYPNRAEQH